jgi:hypothetical protein
VFSTKVYDIFLLFSISDRKAQRQALQDISIPVSLREIDRTAQRRLKGKILPSWVPLTKLVVQIQKGYIFIFRMSLDFISLFLELGAHKLGISLDQFEDFLGINLLSETLQHIMSGHSKRVWAIVLLTLLLVALASLESWLDAPPNRTEDHFFASHRIRFRDQIRNMIPFLVLAIVFFVVGIRGLLVWWLARLTRNSNNIFNVTLIVLFFLFINGLRRTGSIEVQDYQIPDGHAEHIIKYSLPRTTTTIPTTTTTTTMIPPSLPPVPDTPFWWEAFL